MESTTPTFFSRILFFRFAPAPLLIGALTFLLFESSIAGEEAPRLIIDPRGPSGAARELLFTPDGKMLISLGDDKAIRFWEVSSGELRKTMRLEIGDGYAGLFGAGAISPDGRWLAVGGYDKYSEGISGIRIIDIDNGAVAATLKGHRSTIYALTFSKNGRWLASGSGDKDVRVWDLSSLLTAHASETQSEALEIEASQVLTGHKNSVKSVSFSSDANRLASASDGDVSILWKRKEGVSFEMASILEGHGDGMGAASFSPDGRWIASGSGADRILVWDGETGTFVQKVTSPIGRHVRKLVFSPDSQRILVSSRKSDLGFFAAVYSITDGTELTRFEQHDNSVAGSVWHPTLDLVATAGGNNSDIFIWRPESGETLHHLRGDGRSGQAVAFGDFSGVKVAFGQERGGRQLRDFPLHQTFDFNTFTLTERSEFTADPSGFRRVVHSQGDEKLIQTDRCKIETGGGSIENDSDRDGAILSYSFTATGEVVVGSHYSLRLHKATGDLVHKFIGHEGVVWAVSPSRDGRYLASASQDQTVRLWNLKTGELLVSLFVARDKEWVCWTPSGHYHASAGGEKYIGWHINRGLNKVADYFPSYVFRDQYHHPELVKRTLFLGDFNRALAETGTKSAADLTEVLPPKIDWIAPQRTRGEHKSNDSEITAKARISSPNGELTEVKLLLNGKSVAADFRASGNSLDFERTISLVPGENRLALYAANQHSGHTSAERVVFFQPSILPAPDKSGTENVSLESLPKELLPNLYFLGVGISEYENAKLKLDFCDDDAKAIAEAFQKQEGKLYGKVESTVLTDTEATREAVLNGLGWLEKNATQKDIVILFLAAHGANDKRGNYYLLPFGGDFENLRTTGVAWDDFADILGNLPSKTLMFLDTCHSGQLGANLMTFASRGDSDDIDDATEAIRELTSDENGVVIMAASTGREDSVEHPDWGHGAFTMALLEGIDKGGADYSNDGIIHLRELDNFVAEKVKELTGGIQHPTTVKPSTISRFPVARVK